MESLRKKPVKGGRPPKERRIRIHFEWDQLVFDHENIRSEILVELSSIKITKIE